ncbi:NfeD family protein [Ramlibacter monticola]|uniref:NfeD family protein n=1 Tax=Ramlibacter monticola TaxID=1926872 RepID=A0A937CQ28_9BURK|nr:NfeD family protein [Ramlibacter monticola]MBL0389551.1 NfeD family protein [Ramlibacter monticola]
MADSTLWWLLAGAAVAVELLTGTFYLLMLAIGLVAGAVAAHAGASQATQLVVAALVGGGAVAFWHLQRGRRPKELPAQANPSVNPDVGESVHVEHWAADHTATVRYRGANWTVVPFGGTPQGPGAYRVREVVGSRLVVEKI